MYNSYSYWEEYIEGNEFFLFILYMIGVIVASSVDEKLGELLLIPVAVLMGLFFMYCIFIAPIQYIVEKTKIPLWLATVIVLSVNYFLGILVWSIIQQNAIELNK